MPYYFAPDSVLQQRQDEPLNFQPFADTTAQFVEREDNEDAGATPAAAGERVDSALADLYEDIGQVTALAFSDAVALDYFSEKILPEMSSFFFSLFPLSL